MPSTCHWITWVELASEWPAPCMASGVAFITSTISPWPQALSKMAWRRAGRCHSWRRETVGWAAADLACIGRCRRGGRHCSSAQASKASSAIAR